jgi:hypothetical protein
MTKAPKMPKVPDEDGIERHKAYTRMNPMGHKEFVPDDDEETLNELAGALAECAEQFIWNYIHEHLPDEVLNRPDTDDKIDAAIGRGEDPDTILKMFEESISFSGPLPTGGGAGSPEQLETDRRHNRLVGSSGDQAREAGEDVNNFTSSTPQASDGPELSRAKSKIRTSTIRGIGPRNKYIAGHEGDGLDGATRNESFTGTGAIAISPGGGYDLIDDDEEDDDQDPEEQTESSMSRQDNVLAEQIDQLLAEWEPSFKGGEYSPGEYQMPSPTGDGVAERKPKKSKVGAYETGTSNQGKEWPRKHKDTPAMCDVDEDGVEGKPQGSHESSVGDPKDGHQTEMGHNWPDEPKNSGSGVAEPFEGNRWSDGGTLSGGSAQDEGDNKGKGQKMPSTGPITGTSGPQLGQPSESWSPKGFASLMEEEIDLQGLFDSYARDYEMVCVEDFQHLCNAHGSGAIVDEVSLLHLMEANQDFIFYQGEDANGPYWTPTPIAEGKKPFPGAAPPFGCEEGDDEECDEDEDDEDCPMESRRRGRTIREGENRRPFRKPISELQIRPAGVETGKFRQDRDESSEFGAFSDRNPDPSFDDSTGDPDIGGSGTSLYGDNAADGLGQSAYDERLAGMDNQEGPYDGCPECGAPDTGEANCPECGAEMGEPSDAEQFAQPDALGRGGAEDIADVDDWDEWFGDDGGDWMPPEEDYGGGRLEGDPTAFGASDVVTNDRFREGRSQSNIPNYNDLSHPGDALGSYGPDEDPEWDDYTYGESTMVSSPTIMESLHKFMQSARKILENNQEFSRKHIGEALRYSWAYHARNVNPNKTPAKVRATLEGLSRQFPNFAAITEGGDEVMGSAEGTAIGTGGAAKTTGHLPSTDTEMKDEGEPLGASQENTADDTPIIKGTHKGMDGKGSVAQAVKENVARLSHHVQKAIREGARSLRGKYNVQFALVVTEGDTKNRTPIRKLLAEALADAEEVLQLHKSKDVELEANFTDAKGSVVLKHNVPLLTIKPRGLLCSEGAALFRFQRNAERFANELVSEGYTCRVVGHNWGRAVVAKTPLTIAEQAFRTLTEKKWIQGAVNPEHEGYCTPMTKSTCTPRRKALAKRFKKGGDLHSGKDD